MDVAIKNPKFKSILKTAFSELEQLKVQSANGLVHMICGPLFCGGYGCVMKNRLLLVHATLVAEERGWTVFNPIPFQRAWINRAKNKQSETCAKMMWDKLHMPIFKSGLVKCVPFLPFWETSSELCSGRPTLRPIDKLWMFEYPDHWYEEAVRRAGLPMLNKNMFKKKKQNQKPNRSG